MGHWKEHQKNLSLNILNMTKIDLWHFHYHVDIYVRINVK